jgi:hypothetical protein
MLKKVYVVLFFSLFASLACQAKDYFGNKSDQAGVLLGVSIRGNWALANEKLGIDPLYGVNAYYSQKNKFFRLQGRRTFDVLGFLWEGKDSKYNSFLLGASQDIIIPAYKNIFVGTGVGSYISTIKLTPRVNSKFVFGLKFFVGLKYNDECIEFVYKHFSNGDLSDTNLGYDFASVTMVHNFSFRRNA